MIDKLVDLFLETATLKWMPRSGWEMRGVPNPESVAEHSFGVAFVALALADVINEGAEAAKNGLKALDREKLLIMALLHDLAEVRLTDLPISASRLVPREVKSNAEEAAMGALLAPLPSSGWLGGLWQEFEDETSAEGQLIRDVDKLEMMVQCLAYEQAGSRGFDEFWRGMDRRSWHYQLCAEIYVALKARRYGPRSTGHETEQA